MVKNIFFFSLLFFVFDTSVFSQSLEKIIDNYLSARGQSNFNELQTMIVKGERVVINASITTEFKQYIKYPAKFRDDTWLDSMQYSILYNNGKGGIINPFSASNKKENFADISIDKIQSMEKSDIRGLLCNWLEKCKQVTFEGLSTLDKNELYRIKIITNTLDTLEYYIDTKDYLLKQVVYFVKSPEKSRIINTNYKNVKGMQLPFEILYFNNDGCFRKETISEYLINPPIDDSIFEF